MSPIVRTPERGTPTYPLPNAPRDAPSSTRSRPLSVATSPLRALPVAVIAGAALALGGSLIAVSPAVRRARPRPTTSPPRVTTPRVTVPSRSPYATIAKAVDVAVDGDAIEVGRRHLRRRSASASRSHVHRRQRRHPRRRLGRLVDQDGALQLAHAVQAVERLRLQLRGASRCRTAPRAPSPATTSSATWPPTTSSASRSCPRVPPRS